MKYYFAVLGLALGLAGCSSDDGLLTDPAPVSESEAIVLDVKEVASPVTRAQQTGSMTFETLKTKGFGVYGYKGAYNRTSSLPTLFKVGDGVGANTKVEFIDGDGGTAPTTLVVHPGSWKYAETDNLKEWEKNEKYTFFAYAPYVASADLTASGTAGINSVKTEDTAGDPTITYTVAEDPAQSVDLLWGVRTAYTSGGTTKEAGLPWIDIQQGETAAAVQFSFYHALCALGFHAQVMVDQANDPDKLGDVSSLGTIGKSDGCKVTLRKITIAPNTGSFYKSASLNLNNTTAHKPLWSNHDNENTIASLILDDVNTAGHGTIDSKLLDPVANNTANDDYYSAGETLNQNGTKTDVMANNSVPGITETANTQTIIANNDLFMLIPQAAKDYTVTIEYYMTYKTTGPGYHRQSFRGTATLTDLELVAGVKYYINLVFGLTTFKISVDAVDWEESTTPVTIATETGTSASNSLAK